MDLVLVLCTLINSNVSQQVWVCSFLLHAFSIFYSDFFLINAAEVLADIWGRDIGEVSCITVFRCNTSNMHILNIVKISRGLLSPNVL